MIYFPVVILSTAFVLASVGCGNLDKFDRKHDSQNRKPFEYERVPHHKKSSSMKLLPDDDCGDHSIRFKADGKCYPLLKQGPCPNIHQWVTVDPETHMGRCSHRMCGRKQVFVPQTGLCHHIHHPEMCEGGRRLFHTAHGDTICDCPIGHYPFPDEDDDCVLLFTQGPCCDNHVVMPTVSGKLECAPNVCKASPQSKVDDVVLQYFPHQFDSNDKEGSCYPIGTACSPCEVLGYNIFERRGECVDLEDSRTLYFSSPEKDAMLDEAYNDTGFVGKQNDTSLSLGRRMQRRNQRQSQIFQGSKTIPNPLLHACRPGDRIENNFKCTHPLVTTRRKKDTSATKTAPPFCHPPYYFDRRANRCQQRKSG